MLFGRKQMAFELFAEVVELLSAKKHHHPEGLKTARDLARLLAEHNCRGKRPTARSHVAHA